MNSLERAKRFLAQKASRLALTMLPLAALALSTSPAKASATLASGVCAVTDGLGTCTDTTATGGGNTGLNTIEVSTIEPAFSNINTLDFLSLGAASGSASGEVPVSWDFVLLNAPADPTVSWNITFTLRNGTGGSAQLYQFTQTGSGSTSALGTVVSGSGFISIPSGGGNDLTAWAINLNSNSPFGFDTDTNYSIDIPADATLVLNSPANSSVPEPSTLLLMLPGAALLLRRKKRQ